MSKEWFIKEGGQVCFKSDNAKLNGWDTQSLVDCLNGKEIKISDLEAKLAEKEKEIEKLTEELDYKNFWNDFVDLYTGNKLKTQMLHENWKDKISFAIAELEKVKEIIANHTQELWTCENDDIDVVLYEEIDKQIKQLKEGK